MSLLLAGKIMTIFLILFQVPFYLHCLASLAEKINRFLRDDEILFSLMQTLNIICRILDRISSHSVLLDDDENIIIENSTSKTKTLLVIRGIRVKFCSYWNVRINNHKNIL